MLAKCKNRLVRRKQASFSKQNQGKIQVKKTSEEVEVKLGNKEERRQESKKASTKKANIKQKRRKGYQEISDN